MVSRSKPLLTRCWVLDIAQYCIISVRKKKKEKAQDNTNDNVQDNPEQSAHNTHSLTEQEESEGITDDEDDEEEEDTSDDDDDDDSEDLTDEVSDLNMRELFQQPFQQSPIQNRVTMVMNRDSDISHSSSGPEW